MLWRPAQILPCTLPTTGIERLEQRVTPHKVRQLPLCHRDRLATHIWLEVALTDLSQKPAETVFEVAFATPEGIGHRSEPRCKEQGGVGQLAL